MPSNDEKTRSWSEGDVPDQSDAKTIAVAAHPGGSNTELAPLLQRRLWAVSEELTDVSVPV